jgi:hypothetical protein
MSPAFTAKVGNELSRNVNAERAERLIAIPGQMRQFPISLGNTKPAFLTSQERRFDLRRKCAPIANAVRNRIAVFLFPLGNRNLGADYRNSKSKKRPNERQSVRAALSVSRGTQNED